MSKKHYVVKIFLVNEQDEILILRRSYTAPRRALTWDLPGGFIEPDEDAATAAIRELFEETGVELDSIQEPLLIVDEQADRLIFRYFFVAVSQSTVIKLSYEHDQFMWVTKQKYTEMVTYQPLVDAFHRLFSSNA